VSPSPSLPGSGLVSWVPSASAMRWLAAVAWRRCSRRRS
jgi:hypothetical protein